MRTEATADFKEEEERVLGIKNQMSTIRKGLEAVKEFKEDKEGHYMECFPDNHEADFQDSYRDNLNKRKNFRKEARQDGQILKKLFGGKQKAGNDKPEAK